MPDMDAIWQVGAEVLAWAIFLIAFFAATVALLLSVGLVRAGLYCLWSFRKRSKKNLERS
jgi:hypothetical protein